MKRLAWPLLFWATAAPAQGPSSVSPPPPITPARSGESYAYLEDPERRSGEWWEPLKYIPLGEDAYLTTGVEARVRVEAFENDLWGDSPAPDDTYLWARVLPYADLHVGPVRVFGQLAVIESVDADPRPNPIDESGVDLLQGFVEVTGGSHNKVTVRGGRFLIGLGYERLVTSRWGPNSPLAFDGGLAVFDAGQKWRAQALYVRPVEGGTKDFDDATSRNRSLWGLYGTRRGLAVAGGKSDVDLYYLGYRNSLARFGGRTGRELRHTLGLRAAGKSGAWDWDWEAFYQIGSFAGLDISAWSLGTITGRTFDKAPLKPRIGLSAAVISGDRNPGDATLGTFNALFPRGKYFGELSPLGPYNLILAQPSLKLRLSPDIGLTFSASAYWRQSTADGIYSIPGQLLRGPEGSDARYIGTEAEIAADWAPKRWLSFGAGVAAFKAGRFLSETGRDQTILFGGVQAMVRY